MYVCVSCSGAEARVREEVKSVRSKMSEELLPSSESNTFESESTRQILLARNVTAVCEVLSSKPSGILITGADRQTRRAIVEAASPSAKIFSAAAYISGCTPSPKEFELCDVLCVDDVDFPSPVVEANVKSLFPILTHKRTIIGLASSTVKVPSSLLRANRFEHVHIVVSPSINERCAAWKNIIASVANRDAVSFPPLQDGAQELAAISPGYGLQDFSQITQRMVIQMSSPKFNGSSTYEILKSIITSHKPFLSSVDLPFVSTSASSTRSSDVPVDWGGHAGYTDAKEVLTRLAEWPVRFADTFSRLGIRPPHGVLLHGPHGCGKTMLASAFLHRLRHANWLRVSANDLFCKYLGESEARVRSLFERGRALSPCVVMIDDINVVGGGRDDDNEGSSGVERRVLASLLTELDGVQQSDVFVLACTSSLSRLDPALVRPGRLDQIVEIGRPGLQDRTAILTQHLRNMPVEGGDDGKHSIISHLARDGDGLTGALLDAICREAAMLAMEEADYPEVIQREHFMRSVAELQSQQ